MRIGILYVSIFLLCASLCFGKWINESQVDIPIIEQADVVVVGGTSAGVAAAVEAAENGSKVFLVASRPYLGQDIAGTYRLWLEPGEEPADQLGKELFKSAATAIRFGRGMKFKYEASVPSAAVHRDTKVPSLLIDGKYSSAPAQSVQYDGDVTIIAELPKVSEISNVHILVYQRTDDFEVDHVEISVSDNKKSWRPGGSVKNKKLDTGGYESAPISLSHVLNTNGKYIRFDVRKTAEAGRVLLAEIIIESPYSPVPEEEKLPVMVRPMQIKKTFDDALINAGIPFLLSCYGTDVLHDDNGNIAGVVVANKSGRQAIRAKVVIDATMRSTLAESAGATSNSYPQGVQEFKRVVVGGEDKTEEGIKSRKILTAMPDKRDVLKNYEAYEYTLKIPMKDGSWDSFAAAEQVARDKTWVRGQVDSSEILFQVPPDPIACRASLTDSWESAESINLDAFRPTGIGRMYVAGPRADISRNAAEQMVRPLNMLAIGKRIGKAASSDAAKIKQSSKVALTGSTVYDADSGEVGEVISSLNTRGEKFDTAKGEPRALEVWGEYDVVVIGGGTGGAPAAISAARQGAKTLLVEYLHGLGGVGTIGLISSYYHGNRVGFTSEIDKGLTAYGESGYQPGRWNVEWKMEWYRSQLRKAGGDLWFGTLGAGAIVEGNRVKGVVVTNDAGRGIVLARVVIDSTGNAGIAAAAGAKCTYTDASNVAVQGTGLPPKTLGAGYTNTDYTFVDDLDIVDNWRAFVMARQKFSTSYDLGQLIDTRERRRIMGDFYIDPLDIWNKRTYPDTIVVARSNFDTHGYTIHPVFTLRPPDREDIDVDVPYRALLPQGIDGIIVTGLAVSAHRDAMPVIRMQPDIQNQGYAMGVAASMLAKENKSTRQLDVKKLQKHLIEKGNLPERVLTDVDSFPIANEVIAESIKTVVNDYEGIQTVLVDPERAKPMLMKAYEQAESGEHKLVYAHILGMLGESSVSGTLIDAVKSMPWDKGWRYTGMGQFGMSMSRLDSYIISLGHTGDKKAVGVILDKVKQLDAESEFSHHRAVSVALSELGDKRAAKELYNLLKKPGMTGHAYLDIKQAAADQPGSGTDTTTRNKSLSELILARGLYRCGDYKGLGEKILKQYAKDFRGHYSRHAQAVLDMP